MFAQNYFTDFEENPSVSNAQALGTLLCDVGEIIKYLSTSPTNKERRRKIVKVFDYIQIPILKRTTLIPVAKQEIKNDTDGIDFQNEINSLWIDLGGEG